VIDMAFQDNTFSRSARNRVCTLPQSEQFLLRDHLLRLDPESRRDRFNGILDDTLIERYAQGCSKDGTLIICYVVDGLVRGVAELHPAGASPGELPEAAFSVEASMRRKGIGALLFRRLVAEARSKGHGKLKITTGSSNLAMRALAKKFGARLEVRQGESSGTLDLSRSSETKLAELATAPLAA
jgi:GNAT superfamily N-acetyltransferase